METVLQANELLKHFPFPIGPQTPETNSPETIPCNFILKHFCCVQTRDKTYLLLTNVLYLQYTLLLLVLLKVYDYI